MERETETDAASPAEPRSCFGYEVRSEFPLRFLRPGGGTPLRVTETDEAVRPDEDPLLEWLPREENPLHARVYADDGRYALWVEGSGWFGIDPAAPSVSLPRSADPVRREERLWGVPAALCFAHRGDLSLHAAAVEVAGRAVVLAGPGRFGKTTLAAGFHAAGHRVLSEDLSCCRLSPRPAVVPGPPLMRVRRDVHERLDLRGSSPVAEDPDRVHLVIDGPRRGTSEPVPLEAVVLLRKAEKGTRLERVPAPQAIRDLWALSLRLPTDEDRTRNFRELAGLGGGIPVWNLHRPLAFKTLPEVIDRIVEECLP